MPSHETSEAAITIDAVGRLVDANEAALVLLAVSLAELLASPPERFTIRPTIEVAQSASHGEWATGGSQPRVGTAGLRRGDGTTIRVAYAIEPAGSGYRARLWPADDAPPTSRRGLTVGDVLREWRSAERGLAELVPGTPEWLRKLSEIEALRGRYQEVFKAVEPPAGDP